MAEVADEPLTANEVAPKEPPKAEPVATCKACGASFKGVTRNMSLGRHIKAKHPELAVAKKAPVRKAAAQRKPRTPKQDLVAQRPKRVPTSDFISMAVAGAAQVIGTVQPPVGAALSFEATAAGIALDQALAGTVVDRVLLQRAVKAKGKWESAGSVLAFPVLVALVSQRPVLYPALEPYMRTCLEDILITSLPAMKKRQERQRKAAVALAEIKGLDPILAESEDPVGDILLGMFSSMTGEEASEPR